MSGDVVPYVPSEKAPERPSLAERQKRREDYDKARLASVEPPMALAASCMEEVAELDAMRRALDEQHPELIAFMEAMEADVRQLAERRRQLDRLGQW